MPNSKTGKSKVPKSPSKRKVNPSLESIVGESIYQAWLEMLRALVPGGRTHRLSVVIAAMLTYTAYVSGQHHEEDNNNQLVQAFNDADETSDPEEIPILLYKAVVQLFTDAGVTYKRTNSRGEDYSIVDGVFREFLEWENMPWE